MEAWRQVFRDGFLKTLELRHLTALRQALAHDDKRIIQGATTSPPPLMCVQDWPCDAACAIGLAGWLGDGLTTVGEVEEFFAKTCYDVDQLMGEPAACRWWLNYFDDEPRSKVFREALEEVDREIALRNKERMIVEGGCAA